MANTELSEDCKQRLREIDEVLASATESLSRGGPVDLSFAATGVLSAFSQLPILDNDCTQVFRDLDASAGALAMVQQFRMAGVFATDASDLLNRIWRVRRAIQSHLDGL